MSPVSTVNPMLVQGSSETASPRCLTLSSTSSTFAPLREAS